MICNIYNARLDSTKKDKCNSLALLGPYFLPLKSPVVPSDMVLTCIKSLLFYLIDYHDVHSTFTWVVIHCNNS